MYCLFIENQIEHILKFRFLLNVD